MFFINDFIEKDSDEGQEKLQRFLEKEFNRMMLILKEKESILKEQCDKYKYITVRKEYASGGQSVHRGYYLPSPIQDIVIDNVNRGKILKRLTPRAKISYEYCYNQNDKLFFVVKNPQKEIFSYEWVYYHENTVIGLEVNPAYFWVMGVNECKYKNGLPISYLYTCFNMDKNINSIWKEEYIYDENGIKTAHFYNFHPSNDFIKGNSLSHQKFTFEHNEEGYLSKYSLYNYNDDVEENVFEIKKKRKI